MLSPFLIRAQVEAQFRGGRRAEGRAPGGRMGRERRGRRGRGGCQFHLIMRLARVPLFGQIK